jgi:hypothetical protein
VRVHLPSNVIGSQLNGSIVDNTGDLDICGCCEELNTIQNSEKVGMSLNLLEHLEDLQQ